MSGTCGIDKNARLLRPFRARNLATGTGPQGVALGCHILPFQGGSQALGCDTDSWFGVWRRRPRLRLSSPRVPKHREGLSGPWPLEGGPADPLFVATRFRSAPKGHDMTARGNAPGNRRPQRPDALKGHNRPAGTDTHRAGLARHVPSF